jgi:iron complex outermembrane receptor protein
MKRLSGLSAGVSSIALLLAISSPAHAAPDQASDTPPSSSAKPAVPAQSGALEEIVVSAEKKKENIQEVPITISAFTSQDIEAEGLRTTEDLQMRTPGFNLNLEFEYAQLYIRGIGENYTNPGLEPSVAVYTDGVYNESALDVTPLFDMASVQVLKGPQGTLYGRNATGGAVLLETQDPLDSFGGRVFTSFGNYDHWRNEAVLNLPVDDTLKIRLAGMTDQQDGYIKNETNGAYLGDNAGHKELFRAKVEWTPTDWLDILESAQYYNTWQKAAPHQEVLPFDRCGYCIQYGVQPPTGFYDSAQNVTDSDNQHSFFDNVRITAHLSPEYDLVSVTGFTKLDNRDRSDQDFTPYDLYNLEGWVADRNFYEEMRLNSNYTGPLNFLAGLVTERDQAAFSYNYGIPGFGLPVLFNQTDTNIFAYSGYLEGYYKFSDAWKLTLGGRYSFDRKFIDTQNAPLSAAVFGDAEFHSHATFYNFTPRAVLSYTNDWGNYYINYQKGFKSGGFNTPAFTSENDLGPEKITSVEVGAKNAFLDQKLQTNASVFHYSTKGLQVQQTDVSGGNLTSYENAASSETYGLDLDVQAAVTQHLKLGAGAEYLHARFTQFRAASVLLPVPGSPFLATGAEDLAGHVTPHSPAYTGYLSATYTDSWNGWDGEVTVIANGSTSYEFNTGAGGPLRLDKQNAFATANVTGFISPPEVPIRIGFYINNVTDTQFNEAIVTNAGSSYRTAGLPLMFGGSIEYDF